MSIYDEMRNDIEVLYGRGACGYNVYSNMIDYIDEAGTDYAKLKKENDSLRKEIDRLVMNSTPTATELRRVRSEWKKDRDENVKLRELADAVKEFVEDTHCEDCPFRRDCDDNNRIFCADDFSYHAFAAMRELGIGVD